MRILDVRRTGLHNTYITIDEGRRGEDNGYLFLHIVPIYSDRRIFYEHVITMGK